MSTERTKLSEAVASAFREGSPTSGSRREITIIRSGWGSSGYYSPEVLERDIPRIFPPGSQMYLNHPTQEEDQMRPERDLRDLVGKVTSEPRMAGVDSVSEAHVYDHWQPVIEAIAPDVGLSIRAFGIAEHGSAGGKEGMVIQSLTEGLSIDYVTKAGAGGAVGPLIEAAREHSPAPTDQAITAFNAILESAGKQPIPRHLLEEVLKQPTDDDLVKEAETVGALPVWESEEMIEAESLYDQFLERDVSDAERIALAKKGQAIPIKNDKGEVIGGRFPMANCEDVKAAAMSVGRGKGDDIKSFIKRVASKLSCPVPFKEAAPPPKPKEDPMADSATLESLQESMRQLQDEVKTNKEESAKKVKEAEARAERAEEALLRSKAADVVARVVNEKGKIPAKARTRIVEAALGQDLPTRSDGSLDESVLEERARGEIRKEEEYLEALIGKPQGGVRGAGPAPGGFFESGRPGSNGDEPTEEDTKSLVEAFKRQGMSEEAAKAAAEGR